jgi:pyruvate/2-oxoglutarate dehydrogenase complex dihydrolipoamide acyltransferase (E2) component
MTDQFTSLPIAEVRRSRAGVLQQLFAAAGAAVAGGAVVGGLAGAAASAPSPDQDIEILNFALVLEHIQSRFYADANARGSLRGELRDYARIVGAQEAAHLAFLKSALGPSARPLPRVDFGAKTSDPKTFAEAAVELEDLTRSALAAAAKIVSVEARHAAWIRDIVGQTPAPKAAEVAQSGTEARAALRRTGFLA